MKTLIRSLCLMLLLAGNFAFSGEMPKTVNINNADAKVLAGTLNGVGRKRAEAIVSFREIHGPFQSVEELRKVRGVNKRILAKNRERIVLE